MAEPRNDDARRLTDYPLGASITLAALDRNLEDVLSQLRDEEPVSWIAALGMWFVTRYDDVRSVLFDSDHFTTGTEHSLLYDTFGEHLLTTEGATHERYRRAFRGMFTPAFIRDRLEAPIRAAAIDLIEAIVDQREIDLRPAFARRLPIQAILLSYGFPANAEIAIRDWYDSFEKALANFTHDPAVRSAARRNVAAFRQFVDESMFVPAGGEQGDFASALSLLPPEDRPNATEVRQNLSIIFFGAISTVEALILNSLWALFEHPPVLERLRTDIGLAPNVIEETLRWLSPVQSATRHVVRDCSLQGVSFRSGDIVNCMLGAANRDPAVFPDPNRFDIDRSNSRRHLAFAAGTHACIGLQLAKSEARVGLEELLQRLPGLARVPARSSPPAGYEFRRPAALTIRWNRTT